MKCIDSLPDEWIKFSFEKFQNGELWDVKKLDDIKAILFIPKYPIDVKIYLKDNRLEDWFHDNGDRFINTFFKTMDEAEKKKDSKTDGKTA